MHLLLRSSSLCYVAYAAFCSMNTVDAFPGDEMTGA